MSENKPESIKEIQYKFKNASGEELDKLVDFYRDDARKGVINLIKKHDTAKEKLNLELIRLKKMHLYEEKYSEYQFICGIDEVGRGPLSGPVMAGNSSIRLQHSLCKWFKKTLSQTKRRVVWRNYR